MDTCPNCGADLPPRAKSCPECGSDEKTGWSDQASSQHLGLPDDSFNYDEFLENEFGQKSALKPHGLAWLWWFTAIVLLVISLAFFFR